MANHHVLARFGRHMRDPPIRRGSGGFRRIGIDPARRREALPCGIVLPDRWAWSRQEAPRYVSAVPV